MGNKVIHCIFHGSKMQGAVNFWCGLTVMSLYLNQESKSYFKESRLVPFQKFF
jgi:hypothetical protein